MLYHTDIGLPEGLELPTGKLQLRYSQHAHHAAWEDRILCLPSTLDTRKAQLIEAEVTEDDQFPHKLVYRVPLDEVRDLVLAICRNSDSLTRWTVKTVWTNDKSDNHRTLKRSAYVAV